MKKLKTYLQQARVTQWSKNLIVYLPMFFGGKLFDFEIYLLSSLAFLAFSFSASIVYIFNDIRDLEEDKKHPKKKLRPLASGTISKKEAYLLMLLFILLAFIPVIIISKLNLVILLVIYLLVNFLYSTFLKKTPYLELILVALFYSLRLESGGISSGIDISFLLHAVILSGAFMFTVGKRYSEKKHNETRKVLKFYSAGFLQTALKLTILVNAAFISFYAYIQGLNYLPWLILYLAILKRYHQLVISTDKGESAKIFLDKFLFILILIITVYSAFIIY